MTKAGTRCVCDCIKFQMVHIDTSFRIGPCGISAQLRAEAQNDLRKSHDMQRKCTDRAEFPHH